MKPQCASSVDFLENRTSERLVTDHRTGGRFIQEIKRYFTAVTAEIAECTARTAVRVVPLLCALRVLCSEIVLCHFPA